MKQSERRVINHIKNYIRVLEKRRDLYTDTEKDFNVAGDCLLEITDNALTSLRALLNWVSFHYGDKANGKN